MSLAQIKFPLWVIRWFIVVFTTQIFLGLIVLFLLVRGPIFCYHIEYFTFLLAKLRLWVGQLVKSPAFKAV